MNITVNLTFTTDNTPARSPPRTECACVIQVPLRHATQPHVTEASLAIRRAKVRYGGAIRNPHVRRSSPDRGAPRIPVGMVRSAPFGAPLLDAPSPRFVCRKARPENGRTVSSHLSSAILHTRWRRLSPPRVGCRPSQTQLPRGLNDTSLPDSKESIDVHREFSLLFCAIYTIDQIDRKVIRAQTSPSIRCPCRKAGTS